MSDEGGAGEEARENLAASAPPPTDDAAVTTNLEEGDFAHHETFDEPNPEDQLAGETEYRDSRQSIAGDDFEESIAEATLIEPRTGPEAEERAFEQSIIADAAQTGADPIPSLQPAVTGGEGEMVRSDPAGTEDALPQDDFSPFADDVDEPSRKPAIKVLLLILLIAALAILFWFAAPPSLKARVGMGGPASPLALAMTHMDRQKLESGNELLTVTGRVINPTSETQQVPPLEAQLKSASGTVVYKWTIAPPAPSLAPGASASFNSAEVNVPPGGDAITLTLGGPQD